MRKSKHLKETAGENIEITGSYPVDIAGDLVSLLRSAQHNEYEEHDPVYKTFGDVAMEEGFPQIASSFHQIAQIEKVHGDRFGRFADALEDGSLFVSDVQVRWICLNCGAVIEGKEAPSVCPVCQHDRGYFIRFELSPFESEKTMNNS